MNKSKFLRKSLALLLSVLMVVAMIPVGASAADVTTDLAAIKVNGNTVSVNNKTFSAEVSDKSVNLLVEGLYTNETAKVTDVDEADTQVGGSSVSTAASIDLDDFEANGNVYTVPLILTNGSATASYTIKLTLVAKKTTVELSSASASITAGGNTYTAFKAGISGKTINVSVPVGYTNQGTLTLVTKDNAVVVGGAKVTDTKYTVSSFTDNQVITVKSENLGNTTTYKVKLTYVSVLNSVSFGDVAATLTDDLDGNGTTGDYGIKAELPTSVLTIDRTTGKRPAEQMVVKYTAPASSTVSVKNASPAVTVKSGDKYDLTDGHGALNTSLVYEVTCMGITTEYTVALTTTQSANASIVSATVDGETATVSGNKITANVQSGYQTTDKLDVVLTADANATITGGHTFSASATADDDGNKTFTASDYTVSELKAGVIVKVTAQNGTQKQYELKITATGDVDEAVLNSFALVIDGETYKGSISGSNVTVTVPYMTSDTDLSGATIVATTNAYVKLTANDGTTAATTGSSVGLTTITPSKKTGTATAKVIAVAKNNSKVQTAYTVTVKLETAQAGKTLSSIVVTSSDKYNGLKSENTYKNTSIKNTATNEYSVTVKPSYSDCNSTLKASLYIKEYATANGGVAYLLDAAGTSATKLDTYVLDDYNQYVAQTNVFATADVSKTATIVVVDEVTARAFDHKASPVVSTDLVGNKYTVKFESQAAKTGSTLSSLKFGDTTIGSSVSGTVAYSVTASDNTAAVAANEAIFIDFAVSENATLSLRDKTNTSTLYQLTANGDTNSDGTAEAVNNTTNHKVLLVRDTTKGTVTVYAYDGTNVKECDAFVVTAEDGTFSTYGFTTSSLKYAAANTEAKITAFSVAGIAGSIKAEGDHDWTITVNAPLGTDVTSLVPTFTKSAGAAVTTAGGSTVTSGETALDFSSNVTLKVTAEDGGKSTTYTVKVTVSDTFSDVKATDWFYANVMAAYNAKYISGNGDGTFAPNANVTRRDFAIMVYKMLGSPATTSKLPFVDVVDGDYGMTAIAYLKEADIISGDDTGTFRPAAYITRQEAASILAKAKKLSGTSGTLFNDDATISSWASAAVYACNAAGIFNGDEKGNFNAQKNITRAEAATVVYQAASK